MVSQWQVVGEVVKRHCSTGEPDALKGASPVRRGAVGNVLSYETTRKVLGMSREQNSNALAAYSTMGKGHA
jgi:hypothetical protein